ncbi:hypothetical protein SAMN05443287_101589 [Micromonospora phaseoli]|uniref:Uncharacterized protein n=1 Tax=Micromonospora phaseoli TaxID=1144548 RepID=A0A1H6SJH3_9ACTN|nr:hypothetical protein [Micromonospora phaseoli]PZW03838.1 hypothetical protein CLV64_101589 [Micromonospora phaseoli]GIJ79140.1 hypothetical protein Xph01_35720 [Micromonospora phaseoli]SEI63945.1 hypothetical protein SAMN05443287_101589 [Micromonospora phaseoli]
MLETKDPIDIVRLATAEALRRIAGEALLTGIMGTRLSALSGGVREVLRAALVAQQVATPTRLIALCRTLDLGPDAFDLLGHHVLGALVGYRPGPDALVRVGGALGLARRELFTPRTSAPGDAVRVPTRAGIRNNAATRYRSTKPPEHLPSPPAWTCTGCGREWPCAVKQSQLLAEFGGARAALAVYLGSCLLAAARDLPGLPLARARNRFLGWLPRRPF